VALVGGQRADDNPEQRGLAAAIGADQASAFAAVQVEIDAIQDFDVGIPFGDVANVQHGRSPLVNSETTATREWETPQAMPAA
jgi:hypothetical protein